uniref:Dynein axonemal assembly factor 11-like CS domain-containing protein n=1 Tax=Strigamia maritima TaxID=126957 RepID=T1JDN6_STRMM
MVKITEELVRKRSEHNEGIIFSLEEIALHQEDIERIENLDKWCRELKILLLQSNLIAKLENLNKLKKLEYLNLALNNITIIENLQGCESLNKLDLTINFIGKLTSVDSLKENEQLKSLFLSGNPCTDYIGYREYVLATLRQLKYLDGEKIDKSERLRAIQNYNFIKPEIIRQQNEYLDKEKKRKENLVDGIEDIDRLDDEKFWKASSTHTPETRIAIQKRIEKSRKSDNKEKEKIPKKEVKLVTNDGRILNVNEAKIDFAITDDEEHNQILLDLAVPRFMDTSLVDIDVQPLYVRAFVKGKAFQITLNEEVKPDSSTAKRSDTTGHLVLSLPKVKEMPVLAMKRQSKEIKEQNHRPQGCDIPEKGLMSCISICSIVPDRTSEELSPPYEISSVQFESPEFVDDPSVPPLI